MIAIDKFIDKLEVDEPTIFENIAISRVCGDDLYKEEVKSLKDALETRMFKVIETGSVPVIDFENNLDKKVFLACGVIVKGGKQNRAVRYPALIAEKHNGDPTKTRVEVHCAQHGRWSYREDPGFTTNTTIMKANGRSGVVDQCRTWHTIAFSREQFRVNEGTSDYDSIADKIPIKEYTAAFGKCDKHQLGHIVAVRPNINEKSVFFYSDILRQ